MKRIVALGSLALGLAACSTTDTEVTLSARSTGPATPRQAPGEGLHVPTETYTLPNGMTVVLHEDHSLPKVVINTWFAVGSKDEEPGRTGFAHLFEHLMFMGTGRVPDNQFDVIMERGGGANNATTSEDRTNYFSFGPSSLLPTLLWLDADRLDALADYMTQEKLDRQRDVVRNERRQTSENVPYGKAHLLLPEALYPEGHPYHHPVIGSHEDLEAATLEDVVDFFRTYYVPANASLVVAGDFDPDEVRAIIERTFGAIPARPTPRHRTAPRVRLDGETRLVTVDKVEFPKLYLAWHSPAFYREGDAEMDLAASILAGGSSSRLDERLVRETGLCQSVRAAQASGELGSTFQIEALAAPGADLEEIKREILAVVDELGRDGPTEAELARAQATMESSFLRGMESLLSRADSINAYRRYFGVSDGFQRDLERWTRATREGVRDQVRAVFGPGRVDLRVVPEGEAVPEGALDERPADFAPASFTPPSPQVLALENGVPLVVLPRPGTGLFAGALLVHGGESLVTPSDAGLAALAARMLNSGAGGLDKGAFAEAVESLGASIRAFGDRREMGVSVDGLTSRLGATLDRFADVVLRANLEPQDYEREKRLALAAIQARKDNPRAVAGTVARILLFGPDDARGRPLDGTEESVDGLELADVSGALPGLLDPANATLVFVGDFEPDALRTELDRRLGGWKSKEATRVPAPAPLVEPAPGRIVLVDRPGAPQTVVSILRPLAPLDGVPRAARACADTVFGGTFTSRLNANLREDKGYTYGASSRVQEEGPQVLLLAGSAVRTDVTGASLAEFKLEFDRMAADGVDAGELAKAVETRRRRLVEQAETTGSLRGALMSLVSDGRPLDSAARDLEALGAVDLAGVNAVATGGAYAWDDLLIVLVGDREALLPQLREAGFGEPEEVDETGRARP